MNICEALNGVGNCKQRADPAESSKNWALGLGFAGGAADALALLERLEAKLEAHPGNVRRAAVELAREWRADRVLRRLEAMLIVGDPEALLIVSGNGDVLEPDDGIAAIGSGGSFALAAGRAAYGPERRGADRRPARPHQAARGGRPAGPQPR